MAESLNGLDEVSGSFGEAGLEEDAYGVAKSLRSAGERA
jgi:hypothetical protein